MPARIGKYRETKRIDRQPAHAVGVASGEGSGQTIAPAVPIPQAPGAPTLTTALTYSAVTSAARIDATWQNLETYDLETYAVQISTDSTFATDFETYTTAPNQNSATIPDRRLNTTYYVRVRTIVGSTPSDWSASANITTPAADTVAPAVPTSVAAAFIGTGDLMITWVNPTSVNFQNVEIKIYASNGGALLGGPFFSAGGLFIWTAAQNLAATSQVGDPTLYVELRSHNWYTAYSAVVSASATKTAPTAPTIGVDFTGADCVYTITPPADAAYLSFVADTAVTARRLAVVGRYVYPFDQNRLDHSGTPDPSLAYSFTAVDGLNQASTATSGTATNAAPSAPTITLIGGFSVLVCRVTSTAAADFQNYEYNWKRDGSIQNIELTPAAQRMRETGAAGDEGVHTWSVIVRQQDVFNQFSSYSTEPSVVLDTLTISYLRAGLIFTDSVGNSLATLNVLKDNDMDAPGVSYAA